MPPQAPTLPERVAAPLVPSPGSGSGNSGSGLGLGGSAAASSLLVAQMLAGNVNSAAGVTIPFGLIVSAEAMEGIEQVESGRSSASGTATLGDQETVRGDTSDNETEGGGTANSNVPHVPGYGDLRVIYVIVCVPRTCNGVNQEEIGEAFRVFIHVKKTNGSW